MIKIGLTGGIGSGKSTVAKLFEVMQVPVFYADVEAKFLMRTDANLKRNIIALLGSKAYNGEQLNRSYISQKIFNNSSLLSQLNGIVHPTVRNYFNIWCEQYSKVDMVVQEAAIIFENSGQQFFDKTILVTAPEGMRVNRVVKRDEVCEYDVRERMKNQWSDDEKRDLADFVINNDNGEMLIVQLNNILKNL